MEASLYLKSEKPRSGVQCFNCLMGYCTASVEALKNCTSRPVGTSVRGIGSSFQLAITTSRYDLIDYGTATAQS